MPTIQSKKYENNVQFVDVETWKSMQEKGIARRFRVIDDDDIQETIVGTPEKIIEFADTNVHEPEGIEAILSRDDIKALLDDKGIEYNPRLGTEKLLNLLNKED